MVIKIICSFLFSLVAKYAPAIVDFIVPTETTSEDSGIIMQLEAVNVEEKILEYDDAQDKAYFKISATTFDEFNHAKVSLNVYRLMTENTSEEGGVDLSNIILNPTMKNVTFNGRGGEIDKEEFVEMFGNSIDGSSRPGGSVLDLEAIDGSMANSIEVVGVAYADGILRVQVCKGNLDEGDRYVQLFLKGGDGITRVEDACVYWRDEIDGVEMDFSEHWFLIEEKQLKYSKMYGIFNEIGGCVEGNWEVTVPIE